MLICFLGLVILDPWDLFFTYNSVSLVARISLPSTSVFCILNSLKLVLFLVDLVHNAVSHSSSFFFFLGPHPWHMEVPRLGVESGLQLPAYTTATATQNLSHAWDLHHSSQQCWNLNPLSEATSLWILVRLISAVLQWELPGDVL